LANSTSPECQRSFQSGRSTKTLKADLLGEHNEQILSEILGCSQEEITALYREGAIVRDPCLERTDGAIYPRMVRS
jgi:crotonobetainyl-CoA:carnitine CoA-transferase CaiB-like acyl-CoA transferase